MPSVHGSLLKKPFITALNKRLCQLAPAMIATISLAIPFAVSAQQVVSHPVVPDQPTARAPLPLNILPNDPLWDRQWYLRQIGADRAWTVTTGTRKTIVAVIDVGVDIDHPDLRDNIWTNVREQAEDGIDNDRNGFIDDVHGWNFVSMDSNVRPLAKLRQTEEAWSHGTMTASLIAAKGNDGIGMAGVAWNVQVMPLVALGADGGGDTQDIVKAIRYAVNMGASVVNLSLVGYEQDPALTEMIARAANAGVVVVAAGGNDDESKTGINIDEHPRYPACGEGAEDSVIGIGGTDALDQKAAYANFGKRCIDLSAPAYDMVAARPSYARPPGRTTESVPNYRERVIGTSVAAPLVSGAAALLKSVHPEWTARQIRERLYSTADPLQSDQAPGTKTTLGYGRLNIGRALLDPVLPISILASTSSPRVPAVSVLGTNKKSTPLKLPIQAPTQVGALTKQSP